MDPRIQAQQSQGFDTEAALEVGGEVLEAVVDGTAFDLLEAVGDAASTVLDGGGLLEGAGELLSGIFDALS